MAGTHASSKAGETARTDAAGRASARSGPRPGPGLPASARLVLALQSTVGNQAAAGMVQRWQGDARVSLAPPGARPAVHRHPSAREETRPTVVRPAVEHGTSSWSVQRKLNALGKYKVCGPLAATSATWAGFLADEDIVELFFPAEEADLKLLHAEVVAASEAHKGSKGAGTGNTLLTKHTKLVALAKQQSVSDGGDHWTELLDAALAEIQPQPDNKFIQKNAKDAAAKVWPTALLGAFPDTFWKAVLKDAKPKPAPTPPKAIPAEVSAVLTHADERFAAWIGGHETNRGAWAGSDAHGAQPADYEGVSPKVITGLMAVLPTGGWRLAKSLSAAEGDSLHKWGGAAKGQDFIYHL